MGSRYVDLGGVKDLVVELCSGGGRVVWLLWGLAVCS